MKFHDPFRARPTRAPRSSTFCLRFSDEIPPPNSLTGYLSRLFASRPGYDRIIVFVVTNVSVDDKAPPLSEEDARRFLAGKYTCSKRGSGHCSVPRKLITDGTTHLHLEITATVTSGPPARTQNGFDARG
jgi:hypothetical protein